MGFSTYSASDKQIQSVNSGTAQSFTSGALESVSSGTLESVDSGTGSLIGNTILKPNFFLDNFLYFDQHLFGSLPTDPIGSITTDIAKNDLDDWHQTVSIKGNKEDPFKEINSGKQLVSS